MRQRWGLVIAVLFCLVAYGSMALVHLADGTLRAGNTSTTIALYLLAGAGFVVALLWAERRGISTGWLWGPPVAFRLLLLATEPTLSDDVYRYLWDGHLLTQGVNPYSHAIAAAELDRFEIAVRALTNNQDLSSPYLPAAQLLFAAMATLGLSSALSVQVVMTLFDLGTAVLLYRLLVHCGLPGRRVLIYLWNPLVVVEIAHGAHIDGFMVFLAVAALYYGLGPPSTGTGSVLSPVALALATLTRPLPLLLTPILWWRWSWPQRIGYGALLVGMTVPFGFGVSGWGLFGPPTGTGVFGSARVYSQEFRFNAVVSTWLERLLDRVGIELAPVIGGLMAVVLVGVWVAARGAGGDEQEGVRRLLRLAMVPLVAYVLLTPVLHPWYLVLLLALLVFQAPVPAPAPGASSAPEPRLRWLVLAPWLYLSGALSLSYLTYVDPDAFGELEWVRRVEWFPLLALLVLSVVAPMILAGRDADNVLRQPRRGA